MPRIEFRLVGCLFGFMQNICIHLHVHLVQFTYSFPGIYINFVAAVQVTTEALLMLFTKQCRSSIKHWYFFRIPKHNGYNFYVNQ